MSLYNKINDKLSLAKDIDEEITIEDVNIDQEIEEVKEVEVNNIESTTEQPQEDVQALNKKRANLRRRTGR